MCFVFGHLFPDVTGLKHSGQGDMIVEETQTNR